MEELRTHHRSPARHLDTSRIDLDDAAHHAPLGLCQQMLNGVALTTILWLTASCQVEHYCSGLLSKDGSKCTGEGSICWWEKFPLVWISCCQTWTVMSREDCFIRSSTAWLLMSRLTSVLLGSWATWASCRLQVGHVTAKGLYTTFPVTWSHCRNKHLDTCKSYYRAKTIWKWSVPDSWLSRQHAISNYEPGSIHWFFDASRVKQPDLSELHKRAHQYCFRFP